MILLPATTKKLQVVTGTAATVDVHASYIDAATATAVVSGTGSQDTAITTATTTDVVAAPGASTTRNIKYLNVFNKDAAATTTVTVNINTSAVLTQLYKTALQPNETLSFHEGIGWFKYTDTVVPLLARVLTADDTGGQAVATVQPWFPTNGTLTVPASTTYRLRGLLAVTHGATTHTTALAFGGTATLTSIDYFVTAQRSAANALSATYSGIAINTAASTVVDVTSTAAATYVQIDGILRTNAAGTLIPQFQFSANPTGTITVKRNTFITLQAMGDNTFAIGGTWT